MTVFEVGAAIRRELIERVVVYEKFVARGDKYPIAIKRDASKTPIPTSTLPINVPRIPIYCPQYAFVVQIDQVNATVALALTAATNDGRCNKRSHRKHFFELLPT